MHAAFILINFLFLTIALLVIPKCCSLAEFFTQTAGLVGGFFHTTVNFLIKRRDNVKTVIIECTKLFFFYTFKDFLKHSVLY